MIRNFKENDIDAVMKIWLDVNIDTHNFIQKEYWKSNYNAVKELMPMANIYIYEDNCKIQGFIGLTENYIAGIFINKNVQSRGIGKQLLNYAKQKNKELYLNVYQKNKRAVKFYQRENFVICKEQLDKNTKEAEFIMLWKKL